VNTYRGRFAPSPTGPLHFGSLVAALASYLDARAHSGEWLVRIEDVDRPRTVPGAAEYILQTLRAFGFRWNEPVVWQSNRTAAYEAALNQLRESGAAYPCSCSRAEAGEIYPGTCRSGPKNPERPLSWRVRCDSGGDFIIRRSDGLFAYQLAVVVDDAAQRITDVVRGADLLDSTPRQVHLFQLLGLPVPRYWHIPVVTNEQGEKLSKQTRAPALNAGDPVPELRAALRFLGQSEVSAQSPGELLTAAAKVWTLRA
jgi:glutamyl-Q tRNA(Asp) synthetase